MYVCMNLPLQMQLHGTSPSVWDSVEGEKVAEVMRLIAGEGVSLFLLTASV